MADADEIAALCYGRFAELPRRGKPEPGREWTLMAAVVQLSRGQESGRVEKEVVSLGTGTKCIGRSAMSPNGDVLNDSHAEVLARRGCVRYLIRQLRRAVGGGGSGGGGGSVFEPTDEAGRWRLKPGVSFVFFTSHTPCGDASIIPMTDIQTQPCPPVPNLKRRVQEPDGGPNTKRPRLEVQDPDPPQSEDPARDPPPEPEPEPSPGPDVHRTGAKCVPGGPADPLHPGSGYHSTGVLRVKPGRGEPTMSLSCSDKLARWGVVGFQGALLAHYLQGGLYFSSVVVGKCPYSAEVMHRALVQRCSRVSGLPVGFSVSPPALVQSSLEFPFNQTQTELQHQDGQGRMSPCGAAISWCSVPEQPLDVTVNGYKHGVTRKLLGTAKARSVVCKLELFHSFLSLVSATASSALPSSLRYKQKPPSCSRRKTSDDLQTTGWISSAYPVWESVSRHSSGSL